MRRINFSVGSMWGGFYTFEILIDGSGVSCKDARISYCNKEEQLKNFFAQELRRVEVSQDWLAELDALDIFSWQKEYVDFPQGTDGIWWRLTFEDGGKIYCGHGLNISHKNWSRLMDWLGVIFREENGMAKQLKLTVGNDTGGYKSVELKIDGNRVAYKILRGGLLNVGKKNSPAVKVSEAWLAELDALNIFSWEENYSSEKGGELWTLTFTDGEKIYHGRGANAYPEDWERFLDWLDALIPELEFINRKRLERVTFDYGDERLTLDRRAETFTLDKKNSSHAYELGDDTKKFFDACQKIIDAIELDDADLSSGSCVEIEVALHDGTTENYETLYNENFLPGLTNFLEELHAVASDLTAEIFSLPTIDIAARQNKLILCKVQFSGSYKHYTYRTDDETLSVGDEVDVPVGRNNDINQAKIVEIGYYDEYEAPFPLERIKKVIGKHVASDWDY